MLDIIVSSQFKKDLKKVKKQGKDPEKIDAIIEVLQNEAPLHSKHCDHDLIGIWKGYRECHITPDWLLIYKICNGSVRVLRLSRTGSHSDLFKK